MGTDQTAPGQSATLAERCRRIDLLVLDIDGVLTDGGIVYSNDEREIKRFHVRDGSALKLWHASGKASAILSGRSTPLVDRRGRELGVTWVIQGAGDKGPAYDRLLREAGRRPEQVCCMGDDVPDLPLLRRCGLAVAVADACVEARAEAHYVTRRSGGRGAVREAVERIMRVQGSWQEAVAKLLEPGR